MTTHKQNAVYDMGCACGVGLVDVDTSILALAQPISETLAECSCVEQPDTRAQIHQEISIEGYDVNEDDEANNEIHDMLDRLEHHTPRTSASETALVTQGKTTGQPESSSTKWKLIKRLSLGRTKAESLSDVPSDESSSTASTGKAKAKSRRRLIGSVFEMTPLTKLKD